VICRGIDRQKIFTDQNDYLLFLKRLAALLTETRTSCIAWALIPNPFHLLLRTGNVPIVFGTDIAKSSSALTLSKRIVI
jgi:hypothetical protein